MGTLSLLWLCTWVRPGHAKVIPTSVTTFSAFTISPSTFLLTKEWSQAIPLLRLLQIKEEFYVRNLQEFFHVQTFHQGAPTPSNDVDACQDGT